MLLPARNYVPGSDQISLPEPIISQVDFKIHKLNTRRKPEDTRNIVVIPSFSEFGCETLAVVYCLPKLLKMTQGKYTIVIGWHGRKFFYKHLVDEFWEIDKKHMWLREYCRAFHHVSKNLIKVEKEMSKHGKVLNCSELSNLAVFPSLKDCPYCGGKVYAQTCFKCGGMFQDPGIFSNINKAKKQAVWLPNPCQEKLDIANKTIPENSVGITARNRKTWSRNLDMSFYLKLIDIIKKNGYNPIWLGEKESIHPAPEGILDLSSSDDLELTFAYITKLKFTIQFWTASSRLAGLMGVPYIIIESPDQFWEMGQEGYRSNLLTRGEKKRVFCHYKTAISNPKEFLSIVENSIIDVKNNDFEDVIGLVEDRNYVLDLQKTQGKRIGD